MTANIQIYEWVGGWVRKRRWKELSIPFDDPIRFDDPIQFKDSIQNQCGSAALWWQSAVATRFVGHASVDFPPLRSTSSNIMMDDGADGPRERHNGRLNERHDDEPYYCHGDTRRRNF